MSFYFKKSMKTCGFCKVFCRNEHCIVYEENMDELDKLIKKLEWTTIYTKEDLRAAYELGQKVKVDELKGKVKGAVVNGNMAGIITEKDLK